MVYYNFSNQKGVIILKKHPDTGRFMKDEEYEALMKERQPKPKRGRGRPSTGKLGVVSIRMPDDDWNAVDSLIDGFRYDSRAEFFAEAARLLKEKEFARIAEDQRIDQDFKAL